MQSAGGMVGVSLNIKSSSGGGGSRVLVEW